MSEEIAWATEIASQRAHIARLETLVTTLETALAEYDARLSAAQADAAALRVALKRLRHAGQYARTTPGKIRERLAAAEIAADKLLATDDRGQALLSELAAARALGDCLTIQLSEYGRCCVCHYYTSEGPPQHADGCTLAAYGAAQKEATGDR